MVIHYVEHQFDTCPVQCLYHLLELADACLGISGIGRVASLRHVVVQRVVAPVILWYLGMLLIHGEIVIRGQDMHMCHAQVSQMVNARRLSAWSGGTMLRQRQKFSLVLHAAGSRHGEVTMVHLMVVSCVL